MKSAHALFTWLRVMGLGVILWPGLVLGQPGDTPAVKLSSPQQAVRTHLGYLQSKNYQPAKAAQSIPPQVGDLDRRIQLARQLKQVLDARGIYINLQAIPDRADYRDSSSQRARYPLSAKIPEIVLSRQNRVWRYTLETARQIPRLHEATFPLGADVLVRMMPRGAQQKAFGLALWQWLGLAVVLTAAAFLQWVLRRLIGVFLVRLVQRMGRKDVAMRIIRPVARPLSLAVVFKLVAWALPVLQLPVRLMAVLDLVLLVAIPVFVTVVFYNGVALFNDYFARRAASTENTLDDQLVPLVRRTTKTLVIVLGLVVILRNLGISVTALVTGISIGGLALALAAQDTLKNFFGSLMIFVDRPFGIGDWIVTADLEGVVEEVGFRSTRVRTFANSLVYIPNGRLADSTIDNKGLRSFRRYYTIIQLTYDNPTAKIDAFAEGIRNIIARHPRTRKDFYEIHLNDFGEYDLKLLVYLFFECETWSEELKSRHEVIRDILQLAEAVPVRFAFPARSLHFTTTKDHTTLPESQADIKPD